MPEHDNPNLQTNDPALAVVIERLLNLSRLVEDSRTESRTQINALRVELKEDASKIGDDLKEVQIFIKDMRYKFTIAKGSYMVVAAITVFAAWAFGILEKLYKLTH
jgi:hypothetical protein